MTYDDGFGRASNLFTASERNAYVDCHAALAALPRQRLQLDGDYTAVGRGCPVGILQQRQHLVGGAGAWRNLAPFLVRQQISEPAVEMDGFDLLRLAWGCRRRALEHTCERSRTSCDGAYDRTRRHSLTIPPPYGKTPDGDAVSP